MKEFLSVSDFAEKWNMSERGVRNYCSRGKIPGSYLQGKTWMIPIDAKKPERINKKKRKPEMPSRKRPSQSLFFFPSSLATLASWRSKSPLGNRWRQTVRRNETREKMGVEREGRRCNNIVSSMLGDSECRFTNIRARSAAIRLSCSRARW